MGQFLRKYFHHAANWDLRTFIIRVTTWVVHITLLSSDYESSYPSLLCCYAEHSNQIALVATLRRSVHWNIFPTRLLRSLPSLFHGKSQGYNTALTAWILPTRTIAVKKSNAQRWTAFSVCRREKKIHRDEESCGWCLKLWNTSREPPGACFR